MDPKEQIAAVKRARLRLALSLLIFTSGAGTTIAGVAVIFWPAALIVGGVALAFVGSVLIDIPDPIERERRREVMLQAQKAQQSQSAQAISSLRQQSS